MSGLESKRKKGDEKGGCRFWVLLSFFLYVILILMKGR